MLQVSQLDSNIGFLWFSIKVMKYLDFSGLLFTILDKKGNFCLFFAENAFYHDINQYDNNYVYSTTQK